MAIEEEVSKPSSLPSYPKMIMEAIDALKQTDGADASSISEYIESKYEDIPAEHEDVLAANLTSMKDKGELLLINNKYHKPGNNNNAPVKRGRGRPRKDPNAPTSAAKKPKSSAVGSASAGAVSKTGRPRGRPRKVNPQAVQNGVEA